jgi:hypothetical protein
MRAFRFVHSFNGGLHRFVHAPGDTKVVEQHNWPVLTGDWSTARDTPFLRFAVNNNNTEEVAVYLGLMWHLTDGLHRCAIPAYYRDQATRLLGHEPRFVAWEYEVDATQKDPLRRDIGFVPARSAVPVPASVFEKDHRAQAGLFDIATFDDLVSLTVATLGDASAEVTLFALKDQSGIDRLQHRLAHRTVPSLADVLEPGDRFIDLTLGVDLGNWDSLIIASKDAIADEVGTVSRRFERAVDRYERRIDETSTIEAMLVQLSRLAAGEG